MTWIVALFLGLIMAIRYRTGEMDAPAMGFIGGIALLLLLIFRPIQRTIKESLCNCFTASLSRIRLKRYIF